MKNKEKELFYLNELSNYKVDSGYSDISGWNVKDAALRTIGTVNNLLVNIKTQRVVYIDVEVDNSIIDAKHDPYNRSGNAEIREFINEKGENHIIIPIGLVDINSSEKYVFAELIDHQTFAETKRIRRDAPIDRDYENAVLESYKRKYPPATTDQSENTNVENTEVSNEERMENIKQRHKVGEYNETEVPENSVEAEAQQYHDKKSAPKNSEVSENDETFYGRSEFDDSRFYRGKK